MDIPRHDIQFTTTDDGVSIAYWEIGSGLPLIITHNWSISHIEAEWSVPSIASFYVALAERFRVIRFDPRGIGMSGNSFVERGVSPSGAQSGLTPEECGMDISAVAQACGLERLALLAVSSQGPVAIDFASRYPDKVIGLIVCDSLARVTSSYLDSVIRTQAAIEEIEKQGGASVPITMFETLFPFDESDQWTTLIRTARAARPSDVSASLAAMGEWDVTQRLGAVKSPTLVVASRNSSVDFIGDSRKLAAGISGSQLRIVDGSFAPYAADRPAVLEAIADLLDGDADTNQPEEVAGFRTIVFTDVVGSTAFVDRVGDEKGRSAMRAIEQLVIDTADSHDGDVIKHLGDGSLISFRSNSSALAFGLALQSLVEPEPLDIRIGMAAGEPIREGGDIHGAVVAQASRVADLGGAGEIIVADSVRQIAIGKGFNFKPRGEFPLKGFEEHTTVWEVSVNRDS